MNYVTLKRRTYATRCESWPKKNSDDDVSSARHSTKRKNPRVRAAGGAPGAAPRLELEVRMAGSKKPAPFRPPFPRNPKKEKKPHIVKRKFSFR